MPVTNVTHDIDTRTIVINAEFEAPIQRIWQIYADPRQLEKVWGPPSCPRHSSTTTSSQAAARTTT